MYMHTHIYTHMYIYIDLGMYIYTHMMIAWLMITVAFDGDIWWDR